MARFPTIPSLDAGVADVSRWASGLAEPSDWAAGLAELDDVPDFDPDAYPEVDVTAGLAADRGFVRTPTRRLFVDYRANPDAFRHLDRLPAAGQSMHGVISGRYALWDLVPALVERTGRRVEDLYLCTLGFSDKNGAEMLGLLDDGRVKRLTLVVSYYFAKTSPRIYDKLVPALLERGQRVLSMRTHAKLLLARTAGRGSFVCESSANLRSCGNVEQFVLTRCPKLYAFHRGWLEGELMAGRPAKGGADVAG